MPMNTFNDVVCAYTDFIDTYLNFFALLKNHSFVIYISTFSIGFQIKKFSKQY